MANMTTDQNNRFRSEALGLPDWPLDDAVEWIAENLAPNAVFTDDELGEWVETNGYTKSGDSA